MNIDINILLCYNKNKKRINFTVVLRWNYRKVELHSTVIVRYAINERLFFTYPYTQHQN